MRLTIKEKEDLMVLVEHTHRDIGYGDGGTYNKRAKGGDEFVFDVKEAERAKRAIQVLLKLLQP